MTVSYKVNEELNGIELYFDSIPNKETRSNLKSNGFRWSGYKKCWYTKQSEKAFKVAEDLTNNKIEEVPTNKVNNTTNKKKSNKNISLWNACQWQEIKANGEQETKQIAKEIRQHVRKRFPMCKFSVRTEGNAYYSAIRFYIVSSPFEKESAYLKAILKYCESLMNAYHKCYSPSDPYTDYAGHYNFSGWAEIDWQYKQTEQTEAIKKDMEDFDAKLAEYEKAEEERKEKEYQEYLKQREEEEKAHQKRQEEEKKQIKHIYNSIDVKTLEESKQYFVTGSEFANLNKNNTLDQYKEEVQKGDYNKEDVKVTKEIHFTDETALEYFSNMLLNDFDFLEGTGGDYTNDNRINSMTDFYNMDEEERKTIKWNTYGVAIYYNNELKFIVVTSGHSYARYVGLTDNSTIKKSITDPQIVDGQELEELKQEAQRLEDISVNVITDLNIIDSWHTEQWNEYKTGIKEALKDHCLKPTKGIIQQIETEELKSAMYKLLTEVDGIQDQFKNANLQQGDRITLFHISGMGMMAKQKVTFDNYTPTTYAQYNNAVRLEFKPENKRKLYYNYYHSTLLVYKGWLNLPETVLNNVEYRDGMKISQSKYHSCDRQQYDEILKYFSQQGLKPIINTYKPQFEYNRSKTA